MASAVALKLIAKGVLPAATGGSALLTAEEAEATFGGILSKSGRYLIRKSAELESRGATPIEIWQTMTEEFGHGTFKGPDGLWRIEYADDIKAINHIAEHYGTQSLPETLGNQKITSEYPGLNSILHAADEVTEDRASYTPPRPDGSGEAISTAPVSEFDTVPGYQDEVGRSVLHETQHALQKREGFMAGTSPQKAGGFDSYQNTGGEIEARDVEARSSMGPLGRYTTMPELFRRQQAGEPILIPSDQLDGINRALQRQNDWLASLGLGTPTTPAQRPDNLVEVAGGASQGQSNRLAAPGIGAGAAGAAGMSQADDLADDETRAFIGKARDAGYTDEQIKQYLEQKSQPPAEEMPETPYIYQDSTPLTWEQEQEARRTGMFTEEQIAQYQALNQEIDLLSMKPEDFPAPSEAFRWASEVPGPDGLGTTQEELEFHEIIRSANELGVDPRTQSGINAIYSQRKREEFNKTTSGLVMNLTTMLKHDTPLRWLNRQFGAAGAQEEYTRIEESNRNAIIEKLGERGIQAFYQEGVLMAYGPDGQPQDVTPGFMKEMGAMKGDLIGGTAGAWAGVAALRALGPFGKPAQLIAGMAGGVAGVIFGDQGDYLMAAIEAQEEWEARVASERIMGAAQHAIVGEVLGVGAYKLGKKGWDWINQAYQIARDGNSRGAYRLLKESLGFVSDDEIRDMIHGWEVLNQRKAPGRNFREQALAIAPTTMPGGENIIAATSKMDSGASAAIAAEVNRRASDLLDAARHAGDSENIGKRVLSSLRDYEVEVKTHFGIVKSLGSDIADPNFRFDLENTSIRPLIEKKMHVIEDPATVSRLQALLVKVDGLTEARGFDELLELRHTVNDFKFNKNINSKHDYDAINEILTNIDRQINTVMGNSPDGRQWLTDWKDANKMYAQYAQTRDNALWKAVHREGMTDESIARAMIRYGPSIDSTYNDVMRSLNPTVRAKVEGSIVEQLVEKYTAGNIGEFRAVQFPMLQRALRNYSFDTPEAARIKEVVNQMAEVYKNDVRLSMASGKLSLPAFQSYLTTDPVVRAQFELATSIFNRVKQFAPGRQADVIALVNKTGKLLSDPLNTQTTRQVIESVRGDQELIAMINRMQAAVAKDFAEGGAQTQRVKVYRDATGKSWLKPAIGRQELDTPVPMHRILQEGNAKDLLGVRRITHETLSKANRMTLMDEGFIMIRLDDGQVIRLD